MGRPWSEFLQIASWKSIEFYVESIDDEHSRALVTHRPAEGDGADYDDQGREPLQGTINAVFFDEFYPDNYLALLRALDGMPGEFIHPIHGSFRARLESIAVHHEASLRDSCVMGLRYLEERGAPLVVADSVAARISALREGVTKTETAATDAGVDVSESTTFATSFADRIEELELGGDGIEVRDLETRLAVVREQIDTTRSEFVEATDLESVTLLRELEGLASDSQRLADAVINSKPPLIEHEVRSPMPLLLLAHALYGDANREDELLRLNRIPNPHMIPAGTKIRCYAR